MKATIKKITMTNFKGMANRTIEFDGKGCIAGKNGSGKTTIASSLYWVFADCDYGLKKNPAITPLGLDEGTSKVEIVMDIDGKEVTAVKVQKKKCKTEKDGTKKVSLSNSYEVNSVEYGERDFKAKMAEYGFNFDLFLPLSHPNVFVSKKSDEMRKILFQMASDVSDKDVAKKTDGADKVTEMLESYSMEEIEAMQKSTTRKIKEVYGKDGEILDATINGLAMSKSDIDTAELELQRNAVKEQLDALNGNLTSRQETYTDLSNKLMNKKFELTESRNTDLSEIHKQREELSEKCNKIVIDIGRLEAFAKRLENEHDEAENRHDELAKKKEKLSKEWHEIKAEKLNEIATICPTCGQEFPAEKSEQIKNDFDNNKASRLEIVEQMGKKCSAELKELDKKIPELFASATQANEEAAKRMEEHKTLKEQIAKLPKDSDIPKSEQTLKIEAEIAEMEQALATITNDGYASDKEGFTEKQMELSEIERKLAVAANNVEIDEKIENLRKKRIEYEQSKANAEAILYQIELVNKKKNEMVQDSINSHFKLVKFKLFDYLKNGEYKEVCTPQTLDGKDIGIDTNTALEIRMKLDILDGLQNFFGQHYPIFLDNAECLDGSQVFDLETQLILLKVTDESFEVKAD